MISFAEYVPEVNSVKAVGWVILCTHSVERFNIRRIVTSYMEFQLSYPVKKKLFAQFYSMLMTDGGISKYRGTTGNDYEIYFIQKYKEPAIHFAYLLNELFNTDAKIEQRKDGVYRARVRSNKKLFDLLAATLGGIRKETRHVPAFIKTDKALSREFLKVVFGCEGSINYDNKRGIKIELACKPKPFKEAIYQMLKHHGISSNIYKNSVMIRRKDSTRKFIQEIGTLECFFVGRGRYTGVRKTKLLSDMLLFADNKLSH